MSLLLVSVQYLSYIYHYVKEWRKNPECSFSCCLALVLPLRNLQGEIGGLAGRNIPRQQLQPGQIDTISTVNTERGSGAVATIVEDYDSEREEEKEEEEKEEKEGEEEKEEEGEEEEEQEQEEQEEEEEEKEKEEEEKEEEEDTANQISVKQGVLVQVSIHLPPKGIQDTKL